MLAMDPADLEEVRYPWQVDASSRWAESSRQSPSERREADSISQTKEEMRRQMTGTTHLTYDEEASFYRFEIGPSRGELPCRASTRTGRA